MKLDHVGIVVKNLENSRRLYQEVLGMSVVQNHVFDPVQKVNLCFLKGEDGHVVELIEPASSDSPVVQAAKRGGGLNHLCYEVPDIQSSLEFMREHGAFPVCDPTPAVAFQGRNVAFVVHPGLGVIELVESDIRS